MALPGWSNLARILDVPRRIEPRPVHAFLELLLLQGIPSALGLSATVQAAIGLGLLGALGLRLLFLELV